MSQIDISQWKEFKITDFYQPIVVPNKIHKIDMYDDLTIPVFSAGGFQGFVDHADFKPQTHYLLFGDQTCTFFYIDYPFSVMDNVKVLKPLADISLNQSLFIQTVAMRALGNIGYSRYWSILKKKVFQLPVDSNGNPAWQYMDTYIAKLIALAHKNVISLKQAKAKSAKLNIDQWGEFKVSDILSRIPVKKTSYKATDLVKEADSVNTIPLVAAGVNNQGVTGYAPTDNLTILQNCLTVSANGANSGTVFYQNRRFSILQDAYALELINKAYRIDTIYIYLASLLTKLLMQNDWTNKATWNIVKDKHIKLPIDAKGEPDWEYMDNQVRHLAALGDLTISSLDPAKLPIFVGEWKEFSINNVFNVFTGAQVPRRYLINGSQERISVTNENNGVISKFDENELLKSSNARILTNFVSINFFGYAFYHKNKASLEMKVHAIQRKDNVSFSENQGLYIASLLNSQYAGKYGYGNQLSSSKLENKVIKLPVDLQGNPDWQYMDQYIDWIKRYSKNRLTLIQ